MENFKGRFQIYAKWKEHVKKFGQSLPGKGKSSIKQISKLEITTRKKNFKIRDKTLKLFINSPPIK